MAEHLLDGAEVGAAFEQVRGEGMTQEMRMHPARLEAGAVCELAENQEGAGAGERPAAGVQEELRPVAAVEVRPAEGEVAAHRLGGRTTQRNEALLAALAEHAHDAVLECDAVLLEPDGLGDPEPGAVEELHQGPVAQRARRRADGGVDETLGLGRRERTG
jgi:hypothetical protein